ncbi:MAG: NOL1/NOP2/sun family putative RNA methylase [Syntrophothermus sp.]
MIELSRNITEYITSLYGSETAGIYKEFIKTSHTTFIRENHLAMQSEELMKKLAGYGIITERIDAVPHALRIIEGAEKAGKTIEYSLGKYYIQSLSSMIPPVILNPGRKDRVLDLCSAPGSKATQMAAMMGNEGTLVTNEPQLDRIKMLVHNIDKLNLVNMGVIQFKGEWLSRKYNDYFDKVLVDAPCSALGVLQKKEEVSNWWSRERMEKIAYHQVMILASAIKMAKPGGEIVYSTCTLTPEENEMIINHVLRKYPVEILNIELPLVSHPGFTSYDGKQLNPELSKSRRILPWEVDSEGFFICKLRKTGTLEPSKPLELKDDKDKLLAYDDRDIFRHLTAIGDTFNIDEDIWQNYSYMLKGNEIFFASAGFHDEHPGFFTRVGTQLGTIDKRGKAHLYSTGAQVLQRYIRQNIYDLQEEKELKDYLSGGTIRTEVKDNEQKVIRFKGYVLGTAAPVSGGLKSQYPKARRIHEISFY